MKKYLLGLVVILLNFGHTDEWLINNIPASFDKDKTIYVYSGTTQILTFSLKTVAANLGRDYKVKFEFDLPENTRIAGMEALRSTYHPESSEFDLNRIILQNIEARESEWQNIQLVIQIPENAPANHLLKVKLSVDGKYINTFEWPMVIEKFTDKGTQLKHLRLGLWDYGLNRCEFAADEIAEFLVAAGINYNHAYIKSANKQLATGGSVHQSVLANPKYPDIGCDGKPDEWGYCSSEAVIVHGPEIIAPGIAAMVEAAREQSGLVNIDYEPLGLTGFSEASIVRFLKESGVTKDDFEKFRQEYAKKKYRMFKTTDPQMIGIYKKWIKFRSDQDRKYIGIIAAELKKSFPEIKFELTCHAGIDDNDISSYARGHNNGAMAASLDAIMPQIYMGYNNVAAKGLAQEVKRWKSEVGKLNPSCKLYPLLLVRYGGAPVSNSPELLRLQIISAVAEGADGVVFYYPQQMNSKYYAQIARASRELAELEEYYQQGSRVDAKFKPVDMLSGKAQFENWPGYIMDIDNPDWHYTAHQLGDRVLLTLFNYSSANDILFKFSAVDGMEEIQTINCTRESPQSYLVSAQETGYVILTLKEQ